MLHAIISFSVKQKLLIGLMVVALLVWGFFAISRLPIDAVPDITDNQVQIITVSPALAAPDVERLITFPIEQASSTIPGLKKMRSFSRFGLSLVTLVFDDATDTYWARQQISERLIQIQNQLPEGVGTPQLAPVTTGLGEIYQYVLRPEKGYENMYTLRELRRVQDWIVRRQLLGVPGVADVSSFGGELKQIEVAIQPSRLQELQLTIQDVYDAINANNSNEGGAYIEKQEGLLFIRTEGLIKKISDIENIAIDRKDGMPLRIHDLATVREGSAFRYGAMVYNDKGEAAGAVVMMLKGANSSEVITQVKERIVEIQKTLPQGIKIEAFLDRSKMVKNAINTVSTNLVEGAIIVIFVLVLFLGNFRAGLIVASVIPLAMLFAVGMMNLFGLSGNLMSLGAIDFGLIVDGAVIIVEAFMHTLHRKMRQVNSSISRSDMDDLVIGSSSKMMNAAVFGQAIILIVYLPIFTLGGIEGKMFIPMAATVSFALLGAFLLSLTYVPMMSSLFISRTAKGSKDFSEATMEKIGTAYQWALQRVLNHPKITLGFTTTFFVLSIFLFSRMGAEFIPELEEGDFAVDTRVLTGSNLNTTIAVTKQSAGILLDNFPEVEKVVSKIGSGEIPTDPMPIEAADMMVILKDKSTWTSAKSYDELAEKMSEKLAAVPGATFGFQFPVQMRFNELMTGAKQDVVVKIFGDHLDTLKNYADKVSEVLHKTQGVQDIYVEPIAGMPQVLVSFKREMLTQYGVNITDANRVIKGLYAGDEVGRLYEAEQFFPIVLRIDADLRKNMEQLGQLQIRNAEGKDIPLSLIADIRTIEGPNQIQREDARRRIIVGFNLRDADVKTVVTNLKQALQKEVQLPAGYYFVYGGSFENLEAAQQRLQIALPFALLLILVLLYFAFGSISLGLLIFTAIPLSAIGGIMALYLRGMPFSISAGVGFIALFGVAVLNGIVLISEFNRIKNAGLHDLQEIVKEGTKQRLRPVLMTAVVASLGFLPMALSNGAGAEVQRPLATVVMGGLLTATVLTLFILPLAYAWYMGRKKTKKTSTLLIIFAVILLHSQSQAQSWPNLKQDILNNNQVIQANNTYQQAYAESKAGAWQFGNTEITVQSGQYNSDAKDLAFSLAQGFRFPTYYAHANSLVKNGKEMIANEANMNRLQIISEAYFQYQFLIITENRNRYYQQVNETFATLSPIISLQYEKGMLSIIEKANLLMLQQKIREQQEENSLENERASTYLSFIAGNKASIQADSNSFFRKEMLQIKTGNNSAALQQRWLNTQAQEQRWKTERSKALPEFKIGYTNQSLNGIPLEGSLSNTSDRFSFISVGLSFPLLNASQYNTIGLQKANYEFEKANYNWESQREQIQKNQLEKQIASHQKILQQYEQDVLPSMTAALKASRLLLQQGQISLMEWLQFINQCEDTYQNYYRSQLICLQSFTELKLLEQSF